MSTMLDPLHGELLRKDVEAIHRLSAELAQLREDFSRHIHEAQVAGAMLDEIAEALEGLPLLDAQPGIGRNTVDDKWSPHLIGKRVADWRKRHNMQTGQGTGNMARAQSVRDAMVARDAAIAAEWAKGRTYKAAGILLRHRRPHDRRCTAPASPARRNAGLGSTGRPRRRYRCLKITALAAEQDWTAPKMLSRGATCVGMRCTADTSSTRTL